MIDYLKKSGIVVREMIAPSGEILLCLLWMGKYRIIAVFTHQYSLFSMAMLCDLMILR